MLIIYWMDSDTFVWSYMQKIMLPKIEFQCTLATSCVLHV